MPIYEYECSGCGNRFETIVWSSEDSGVAACPGCDAEAEKVMSAFAVGGDRVGASGCADFGQTCGGKTGCAATAKN